MIEVDDSDYPLVVVRMVGESSEAEYDRCRSALDASRDNTTGHFVVLHDVSEITVPPARQLRLHAQWMRARASEIRGRCLAAAVVIRSQAHRAVFKALLRLQASAVPYDVVDSAAVGRTLLQGFLDRQTPAHAPR